MSQGHSVADLRNLNDAEGLAAMFANFNSRALFADELKDAVPKTIRHAHEQVDRIAGVIKSAG